MFLRFYELTAGRVSLERTWASAGGPEPFRGQDLTRGPGFQDPCSRAVYTKPAKRNQFSRTLPPASCHVAGIAQCRYVFFLLLVKPFPFDCLKKTKKQNRFERFPLYPRLWVFHVVVKQTALFLRSYNRRGQRWFLSSQQDIENISFLLKFLREVSKARLELEVGVKARLEGARIKCPTLPTNFFRIV